MTQRPTLLPTSAQNESFAGVTYHLDGELVPVLTVELTPPHTVYMGFPGQQTFHDRYMERLK